MQHMIDIYREIVELKKSRMELRFSSFVDRENNPTKQLREMKKKIAVLEAKIHTLRKKGA